MADQIYIEQKESKFNIVLIFQGLPHEMEIRDQYEDALEFACYLANRLNLEVYHLQSNGDPIHICRGSSSHATSYRKKIG